MGPARSNDSSLRSLPSGSFSVSRGPLEAVVAMGFDQRVAAKALYQTWEDPDAAVALLLGESTRDNTAEDIPDSEEEELARAVALSMGSPSPREFVYGVHYPKPIIQPVSLTNTEEKDFNRPQWEESRSQWPAETPTAAVNKSGKSGW